MNTRPNILPDKLCVSGFATGITDREIEEFCEKYGRFINFFRTRARTHVFLTYSTAKDAADALKKFKTQQLNAQYAFDKGGAQGARHFTNPRAGRNTNNGQRSNDGQGAASLPAQRERQVQSPGVGRAVFKNGDRVILVNVLDSFQFFVRPQKIDREYIEFVDDVALQGKDAESLKEIPKRGSLVLAPYNGNLCRALVPNDLQSDRDDVRVKLVDYGVTVTVPYDQLKVAAKQMIAVKFLGRFKLDGVAPSPLAIDCFKSFIGTTLKMECDEPKPDAPVKLIDPDTELNITELINQMTAPSSSDEFKHEPEKVTCGDNKELMVIDNTKLGFNIVTFVDEKYSLIFNKQRNQIQAVGKIVERFPIYTPTEENELILVKHNDHWFRGMFTELKDASLAEIILIDIWKGVKVECKHIRKIPEILVQMPILTFAAEIEGYGSKIYPEKVTSLLPKFPLNENIHVKALIQKDDDDYLIRI